MARSSKDIQLSELKDMISQLNTTIKTLNDTIARQQSENDNLKAELAWFRQKMFGSSSERRIDGVEGQLNLFDNLSDEEKEVELIEPEVIEQPKKSRRKKPTLQEQFKDFPLHISFPFIADTDIAIFKRFKQECASNRGNGIRQSQPIIQPLVFIVIKGNAFL